VCDDAEQAKPGLCPQDCIVNGGQAESASSSSSETSGEDRWGEATWGCDLTEGEGEDHWTVDIEYQFSVAADGRISGSGQGEGRQVTCTRPSCDCSLTLDPFTVAISSLKQEQHFSIQMNPEYNMQQMLSNCPGSLGGRVYQLDLCKCQPGGPFDITLEARDGEQTDFECSVPGGSTVGWIQIHQGKP
jgi:hypothetical protein